MAGIFATGMMGRPTSTLTTRKPTTTTTTTTKITRVPPGTATNALGTERTLKRQHFRGVWL